MTRPVIEPMSPGPLENTLTIMPMSDYIYIYVVLLRSLSDKYPYPPRYGLNSTPTILLEGWLWH